MAKVVIAGVLVASMVYGAAQTLGQAQGRGEEDEKPAATVGGTTQRKLSAYPLGKDKDPNSKVPVRTARELPYPPPAKASFLAFPGAMGFGAGATGGRGGEVVRVTNLEDSGPGSFREAISKPNRIVVFAVSGEIKLNPANIPEGASNVTVLGQTAPGNGITVSGSQVGWSGKDNFIVQYVRFHQGMAEKQDKKYTIGLRGSSNFVIDHCSLLLGRWDCIGFSQGRNATFSNCIIGQSIDPQRFGGLVESDYVTFARNLWIHNESRNPKAKGKIVYVNNVVYNWGVGALVGGHSGADHFLDVVNNVFIAGPSTKKAGEGGWTGMYTETDKVFQVGNLVDLDKDGTLKLVAGKGEDFTDDKGSPTLLSAASYEVEGALPSEQVLEHVLANAGVSHRRDALETRLVTEVRSFGKEGRIYKDPAPLMAELPPPAAAGQMAETDSDEDGIPDRWETAHGLDPKDPKDSAKLHASGYANIEVYAHSLIAPKKE